MMLIVGGCSEAVEGNELATQKISLVNAQQSIDLEVEMAKSPKEREIGLMFRTELDMNKGMLFVFPYKKVHKFWMRNTLIPLDMIFFDDNKIVGIVENAKPHDLTNVGPEKESDMVLEVPAGFVARHKLNNLWQLKL